MKIKIFQLSEEYKFWNVLLLEDDEERVKKFEKILKQTNCKLTHVIAAQECIEVMQKERFDLILLDHDLGQEVFVDTSHKNTGSEVARWMHKNKELFENSEVIIHSFNESAAQYMRGLFPEAEYFPGIWMTGFKLPQKKKDKENERRI